ncbi:MAG TPA: acetyl-CoA carboxylase biotin carboxyl carrier protein subunit, partial [Saprospiraceae bacterium]|nr:acetyl-CoA carboxylase biotin carboxyl carrier protein subunit [Saprospiraceae bacterium]
YTVEVLEEDYANRRYTLLVDGVRYTVDIADYYERLVEQLGLSVGSSHKINSVKAPMPGLVLSVLAEPGQAVQKGDALLILEAMKMENVIKAAGDGVVKAVHVQKGQPVDKGLVLLEFE